MKYSKFDLLGTLAVVVGIVSAMVGWNGHNTYAIVIGAILGGANGLKSYLTQPPATPDTTTLTTKVDTPGVTKSDVVDTT